MMHYLIVAESQDMNAMLFVNEWEKGFFLPLSRVSAERGLGGEAL
jgi:hypothetical protein